MTVHGRISGQIVRFALVGVVNTATYYGCYLLLLALTPLPYVAAHVVAFLLAMTGSFFLNCRFTYRTRPTWRKFLLFPLTNAANFAITTSGVWLLVDVAGFSSRYAPLVAAAVAIPITFVVSRTIMLRPETPHARESLSEAVTCQAVASEAVASEAVASEAVTSK
ncbi:GtrA family protein [Streptomyces ficellus]|uniref:GtrA family protein n=1 Tax=Streptomyces ficellus TaxID=1977088 RepID=A0ABT7Z0V6_9ACTN|nr:GtrA family protein [Streptomyces ficellus]MDN3293123.1 GtrA family protein [Streptomyces ficellus]